MITDTHSHVTASALIENLCQLGDVATKNLAQLKLTGEPALSSSFHVGLLAQSTLGAAAYAAAEFALIRGQQYPRYSVDRVDAECECAGYFKIDGNTLPTWAPLSGTYRCRDGYVRIHANFDHHRDGALEILGLSTATSAKQLAQTLTSCSRFEVEKAAVAAGLPVVALRSFEEWDNTEQASWLATQPLFTLEKIGEAEPNPFSLGDQPLSGVRVLDLTRILAGPVAGRTLAAYEADVMLVNSPKLPNIDHIMDTSRGKRSVHIDLTLARERAVLKELVGDAHVFIEGYRPDGIRALGFGPAELAFIRPGIISVSLSAYGRGGPWASRRGFDSLVQSATGFNFAEQEYAGADSPQGLPVQILDYASGFLMAFAVSAALIKQHNEGGSWHVEVSLAQTALWLRSLGRTQIEETKIDFDQRLVKEESGFGELSCIPHGVRQDGDPITFMRPSVPPGFHPPQWW